MQYPIILTNENCKAWLKDSIQQNKMFVFFLIPEDFHLYVCVPLDDYIVLLSFCNIV